MKIIIETIPHALQRYETVGDWEWSDDGETLSVRVSQMGAAWEYLVAVHELVEAILCRVDGITTEAVDNFDVSYTGDGEPGDSPNAPYRRAHCYATAVERMLCAAMGISWGRYDDAVNALSQKCAS